MSHGADKQAMPGADRPHRPRRHLGVADEVTFGAYQMAMQALAESVGAAAFIFQGERLIFVNAAAEAVTGYSADELLAMSFWDVIHPDHRELVRQRGMARQRGEAVPAHYEVKLRHKSGEDRWVTFSAGLLELGGKPAVLGTAFDVTHFKRAIDSVRAEEARFRALIEKSSDIVAIVDADGIMRYTGPSVLEILGYHPRDLVGRIGFDVVHEDDVATCRALFNDLLARPGESVTARYRIRRPDGAVRWLESIATNLLHDPTIGGVIVNSRDITERREAEALLQASEERHRELVESLNDVIFATDADGRLTYVSPIIEAVTGYTPDEVVGRRYSEFICVEDLPRATRGFDDLMAGHLYPSEYRVVTKSGVLRWVQSYSRPVYADGRIIGARGVLSDISARHAAETARKATEERFALATAGANDGLWDWNVTTGEVYYSRRWKDILGCAGDEVAPHVDEWRTRLHPDDLPHAAAAVLAHLGGQSPFYVSEHRLRHKDGSYRWVLARGLCVRDAHGVPTRVAGSLTDVTDRKREQAELAHMLRLRTLGEMAAVIAHEVNNPLSAIVSWAKGVERRLRSTAAPPADMVKALEEISAQAVRAGEIIRRIRGFVRKGEPHRDWVHVNDIVGDAWRFVEADARRRGIRLRLDLAPAIPTVWADPVQIGQVVVNLLRNGIEAMDGDTDEGELALETMRRDDLVEVRVRDTGVGLSREVAGKVFESFFTTKPHGLGIGLSICTSIVEAHGGRLWFTSNPDGGTTFHLALPLGARDSMR
jgi:PAS domain S-box-containing protein